jgi:hypothetical protein
VTNVRVGFGVSTDDGIGSFGSWNMETTIVFKSKFMHTSSIIFAIKNLYFYKVCRLRFLNKHVKVIIVALLLAVGITFILVS